MSHGTKLRSVWLNKETEMVISDVAQDERLFRLAEFAKSLLSKDYQVTMFFSSFNHFKKIQRPIGTYSIDSLTNHFIKTVGYRSHVSVDRALSHLIYSIRLKSIIKSLIPPDLVVLSVPNIDSGYVLAKYCYKRDIPYVVDVRDLWPDILFFSTRGILKLILTPYYYYLNRKLRFILNYASNMVATSPQYVSWAKEKVPSKNFEKAQVIYLGAKAPANAFKDSTHLDKKRILFVGTLSRQFDFQKVFDAAKKLEFRNDIQFVFVGSGDKLVELRAKEEEQRNIEFLGWLDGVALQEELNSSYLGLLPYVENVNFTGNVTNKFGEYLSYGKPLLVGVSGIMAELAASNNVGFYYQSAEQLVEFILDLIDNTNLYEKMAKNCRLLFEREFDFVVVNNQYENVIITTYEQYYSK